MIRFSGSSRASLRGRMPEDPERVDVSVRFFDADRRQLDPLPPDLQRFLKTEVGEVTLTGFSGPVVDPDATASCP